MGGSYVAEYLYLPYLAVYVIFTFLAMVFICNMILDMKDYALFSPHKYKRRTKSKWCISCTQICRDFYHFFCCCLLNDENHCCGIQVPLFITDTLYKSKYGPSGVFILLFTRSLSVLYLLYVIVAPFFADPNPLNKFSAWINIAMCILFIFLDLGSFIHVLNLICYGDNYNAEPTILMQRFVLFLHFIFESVFVNAAFITVMEYIYLKRHSDWHTINSHFIPLLIMVIDGTFNIIPIRLEHYYYCLAFPIAYLIFLWLSVIFGALTWEIYPFLKASEPHCFGNYTVIWAIHLACFAIVWGLYNFRDFSGGVKYEHRYRVLKHDLGDGGQPERTEFGEGERSPESPEYNDDGRNSGVRRVGAAGDDIEFSDVYASNDVENRFVGSADDADSLPSAPHYAGPMDGPTRRGGAGGDYSPTPQVTQPGGSRTPTNRTSGGMSPMEVSSAQERVPTAVPVGPGAADPTYSRKGGGGTQF